MIRVAAGTVARVRRPRRGGASPFDRLAFRRFRRELDRPFQGARKLERERRALEALMSTWCTRS